MRSLIIDNELPLREVLRTLLNNFCPDITDIKEATGVKDGIEKINTLHPEIVFLDVEMDDGSGFDLLRQLPEHNFQLIFVTAHNQYAIEAFRFSAIDYLLKPVDPVDLQQSVIRARNNIRSRDLNTQVQIMLQQLSGSQQSDRKIVLKDMDKTYFVRVADIIYCEAEGTYTRFFMLNAPQVLVSKNLKEYEAMLEPLGFIRTHHSYLVNSDKIQAYDKSESGDLLLEGNYAVPLSQRKKELVMQILERR